MGRTLSAAVVCVLMAGGLAWSDAPVMKVDEVRAGMKGTLRTVVQGVDPVDIPVEVVDVMRKVAPGRDVILVRLHGDIIEKTGVARGMSGSPVYIDGKLVGCLSFAWRFVREPIAGLTPIESLTRVWRADDAGAEHENAATWDPGRAIPSQGFIEQMLKPRPAFPFVGPANMTALETPIWVSGFNRSSVAELASGLGSFNVSVVEGGGAGAPQNVDADAKLVPGGVMCVQIIRGDFQAAAVGTVTEVAGKRVYALGHPLFNSGPVRLPMATGQIQMIVPSQDVSFKLGTAVRPVGTVWVDTATGIAGEIGETPEMLKVALDVKRGDLAGDARFNFEIIKDPRMMLTFLNAAANGALGISGKPDTKVKVIVKAVIDVEGYEPVEIEEVYGGPQAAASMFGTFVTPIGHILHNPFERVNIKSVSISSEVIPGDPRAVIRHAETEKQDYHPGEEIDVRVTLQPYRSKSVVRHYTVKLPEDVPEGPLTLMVCDAETDNRMESSEMPHRYRPEDAAGVLDFFRRRRPNTDVVIRLSRRVAGLAVKGRELPELPGSVISVLGKEPPTEVSRFAAARVVRKPTEFVIMGRQPVQIRVVKD